jgi:prophage regulatory protein
MQKTESGPPAETGRKLVRGWNRASSKVGRSRTSLWRDVRAQLFPAPITLGPNSVAWFEDEIDAWIAARPRRTYGEVAATPMPHPSALERGALHNGTVSKHDHVNAETPSGLGCDRPAAPSPLRSRGSNRMHRQTTNAEAGK